MSSTVIKLNPNVAEQMMLLFPASQRAHATYNPDESTHERREDGKIKVPYKTVREPVTLVLWEQHLAGDRPLVLGLACDDGTSAVSVVDVDQYSMDCTDLLATINASNLPFYVRRSKSGGAHVCAFHDVPIPVAEATKVAEGMARLLGLTKCEFFPKPQNPDPTKLPKGLNMPYLGGSGGFLKLRKGAEMLVEEFLRNVVRLTAAQRATIIKTKKPKQEQPTGADAGRKYAEGRLRRYENELRNAPQGTRNELLNKHAFHIGTMVPHGWIARAEIEKALTAAIAHWDDQPKTLDTLDRAISDGEKHPHAELADDDVITEDSVALEFAERHAGDLRYDHDVGAWYSWTGTHWQREKTALAFSEARDLARELSRDQKQRIRNITSKANFAGNVERYARADRALVATQASWDRDPFLLGTPGGTVDLRTGELREAKPGDGITKITAVAPAAKADCPLWDQFLLQTTAGDNDLIKFLQVVCGYAMTGKTSEHLLVFIYGPGGNGKSVFLNIIGGLMGAYHTAAAMETFTESRHDRHPTDLAMLRGARLVTCAETSEGRAWAETRIKQMTGGDPVSARFMRQDFFTYQPTFQLLIVGNHKPKLNNITDAIRRRLAIIPFLQKPKEPDRALEEELRAEWPGILRWLIDGCLLWQAEGIKQPGAVIEATDDYFAEQDLVGQWIEAWLEEKPGNILSSKLYEDFKKFAEQAGDRNPGDIKWFHEQMEGRGYKRGKSHGQQVYRGLRIKSDDGLI